MNRSVWGAPSLKEDFLTLTTGPLKGNYVRPEDDPGIL